TTDLAGDGQYADELARLKSLLVQNLYGTDEAWIRDGKLVGLPEKRIFPGEKRSMIDQRGLMNQRGLRFL
ncbi:MAG: hypothetical protein QGI83_23695, partial [Candidatus Latescibacteria bacterium]|nr:hypothetical protein [Candidatus Latescibacterota bacterium]